jgi:hypothetical protein
MGVNLVSLQNYIFPQIQDILTHKDIPEQTGETNHGRIT